MYTKDCRCTVLRVSVSHKTASPCVEMA